MVDDGRAALTANALTVDLGHTRVLHQAGLQLSPGHVTALVGPNGSGKSTLLRTISRLVTPAAGTVTLGTTPADALSAKDFARQVTMLAQQRPTPAGITVRDVVEFGRHPYRSPWRGHDDGGTAAVERALALTDLTDLRGARLETLSGGQLQRAWFASALAQQTSVLLLDEPTNHLDLRYQNEVLRLIRALAEDHGVAIGVVLHDLNHAADIADRIVVLDGGRVVEDAAPATALRTDLLTRVWGLPVVVTVDPDGFLDVRPQRVRSVPPPSQLLPAPARRASDEPQKEPR